MNYFDYLSGVMTVLIIVLFARFYIKFVNSNKRLSKKLGLIKSGPKE